MKSFLHIDFSSEMSGFEVQDLMSGQVYEVFDNVLKDHVCAEFWKDVNKRRIGKEIDIENAIDWLSKGWDGALPLYLSSRHARYLDAGADREQSLNQIFSGYLSAGACPLTISTKRKALACYEYNRVSTSAKDWNCEYKSSMRQRRSVRSFSGIALGHKVFRSILENSVAKIGETIAESMRLDGVLKYTQSYGCAFNIYILSYSIEGYKAGVYLVDKYDSNLKLFAEGDYRSEMSNVNWGMVAPLTANFSVVFAVEPSIYAWRYRHDRALRNLMIEAGRIMHEFIVAAGCFGVQGVVTPATNDDKLCGILGLEETEVPFYTGTFGVTQNESL